MVSKYIEILKKTKNFSPKTILEIGAREGGDAYNIRDAFCISNGDVYIVEPNPEILPHIWCKEFNLYNVAIGPEAGVKKFHQVHGNGDIMGTSLLLKRNDGWYEKNKTDIIDVNVITGKELLGLIGREIDICKIDVEGLTWEVLKSFGSDLTKIKTMHVETEKVSFWKDQKLHGDVVKVLTDAGYNLQWFDGESQIDSIWIHNSILQ
jgi:FkbM family methyltransferase